jgi:hypothetical protein
MKSAASSEGEARRGVGGIRGVRDRVALLNHGTGTAGFRSRHRKTGGLAFGQVRLIVAKQFRGLLANRAMMPPCTEEIYVHRAALPELAIRVQ